MLRGVLRTFKRTPVLCTASALACGLAVVHNRRDRMMGWGTAASVGSHKFSLRSVLLYQQRQAVTCDTDSFPTVPVVTEIPQGSAIYLTGHGDQDINQAETGADPFIFKFTKGYIPKTRTAQDEPLSAIVLGHLESVPGWMLKEAAVVGQLVVMQQDTGVQLSKELVVVAHESNLTKEQIEDLMTDAAASLETLKSEYELGVKVYVQPIYDPTVAEKTLADAKLEYGKQQEHEHKSNITNKLPKTEAQKRRESKQAQEKLEEMPLSDIPLSNLFEELARRGITGENSPDEELQHAPAPAPASR